MITLLLAALAQDALLTDGDAVKPVKTQFEPTKLKAGEVRRIRDADAWKEFWDGHRTHKDAKAFDVDFKTNMVVVVAVQSVQGCVSTTLDGVDVRETQEALRVIPTITQGGCRNSMHGHPVAMGTAAVIVVLPRSAKKLDFVAKPRDGKPAITASLDAIKE